MLMETDRHKTKFTEGGYDSKLLSITVSLPGPQRFQERCFQQKNGPPSSPTYNNHNLGLPSSTLSTLSSSLKTCYGFRLPYWRSY